MRNVVAALALTLASSIPAFADSIYIDVGVNNGGSTEKAAGETTTGWKESLKTTYQSSSTVVDADNSGGLSVGDTISSVGGIALGGLNNNLITALIQSEVFGSGPSDNGYGDDWLLTYSFNDFQGYFNGFDFIYTTGTIQFTYYTPTDGFIRLFDLVLSGESSSAPGNQLYKGTVQNFGTDKVNGVDAGDVFNIKYGNDSMSFKEYSETMPMDVFFRIDQNTDTDGDIVADINDAFAKGEDATISAKHDGSLEFSVPEPTSLAILGLGLIGLAGASRRKA